MREGLEPKLSVAMDVMYPMGGGPAGRTFIAQLKG